MSNTNRQRHFNASPVLWASAFVIAAMAIMQAGRFAPNPAYAGMAVSTDEGFSMVASSSGRGPADRPYDLVYIIDSSEESLYIYWIENANTPATSRLQLRGGAFLPTLFTAGRGG